MKKHWLVVIDSFGDEETFDSEDEAKDRAVDLAQMYPSRTFFVYEATYGYTTGCSAKETKL